MDRTGTRTGIDDHGLPGHEAVMPWRALLVLALAICACGGGGSPADGDTDDVEVEVDGDVPGDGGSDIANDSAGDGDGDPVLELRIETPDGDCVDLSITDRGTHAVRFLATGPAETTVELWVSKEACGVEPFHYADIDLDASGEGVFDVDHDGSSTCCDSLLGTWTCWLVHGSDTSEAATAAFASAACPLIEDCDAAVEGCPPEDPLIPAEELFVLSSEEREIFTPPPDWLSWGTAYEDYPLRNLWEAFDAGLPVAPLDPTAGPAGWYELDGTGSQNHALLWLGVSALGHALAGNVEMYEIAAANCIALFELDAVQGHMRHESVGQYSGFWEGGIAAMALAGHYAPEGSEIGCELLVAARGWWADHVAVLRELALPDGQVTLIGARNPGASGTTDSWMSLSAAINLQLLDPRPHADLHPTIAQFLTAENKPRAVDSGVPCRWYRPRHVAERWVVLRAVQAGTLPLVPENHPRPALVQDIYRWTDGDVVHTATQAITGYRPARWHVSWTPGDVILIEIGDDSSVPHTGKGPHSPPEPLTIPTGAELVLGPAD
jgi:hypothetical protein